MIDDKGGVCATCKHCIVKKNLSDKAIMCECTGTHISYVDYITYCCNVKYEPSDEYADLETSAKAEIDVIKKGTINNG